MRIYSHQGWTPKQDVMPHLKGPRESSLPSRPPSGEVLRFLSAERLDSLYLQIRSRQEKTVGALLRVQRLCEPASYHNEYDCMYPCQYGPSKCEQDNPVLISTSDSGISTCRMVVRCSRVILGMPLCLSEFQTFLLLSPRSGVPWNALQGTRHLAASL